MLRRFKKFYKKHFKAIAAFAIVLVPSIYTVLFLGSMWDPYGNVDNLPVAVVNNDVPSMYNDKEIAIGNELVRKLSDDNSLAFNFVDDEQAMDGLKNGTYYMVITVPPDFSESAVTLLDDKPKKMQLDYKTNPGSNYIASKMSQTAVEKIKNTIAESVTKSYTEVVFERIGELGKGMNDAADGSQQIYDGTAELKDGSEKISSNLKLLADSTLVFKDGMETLEKGLSEYTDGVSQVNDGAGKLSDGLSQLNNGTGTLSDGAKQLLAGSEQLNSGINEYTSGVDTALNGAGTLTENSDTIINGVSQVSDAVEQISGGSSEVLRGSGKLKAGINEYTAGADKAYKGSQQLSANSKALNDGVKQVSDAVSQISDGSSQLKSGGSNLKNGLDSYTAGVDTAYAGASQITANNDLLNAGVATVSDSVSKLSEGSKAMLDGMNTLSGKLEASLNEENQAKVQQVTEGLAALNEGIQQLDAVLNNSSISLDAGSFSEAMTSYLTGIGNSAEDAGTQLMAIQSSVESLSQSEAFMSLPAETQGEIISALTIPVSSLSADISDIGTNAQNMASALSELKGMSEQLSQTDTLKASVSKIADNSELLLPGASDVINQLSGGLGDIRSAVDSQLITGMTELNNGLSALSSGINSTGGLADSISAYTNGVSTLESGLSKISGNSSALVSGAKQLTDGISQVSDGASTLDTAIKGKNGLAEGVSEYTNGADTLNAGLAQLSAGSSALNNGAEELNIGVSALSGGASVLNTSIRQGGLIEGLRAYTGGVLQLKDGLNLLSSNSPALCQGSFDLYNGIGKLTGSVPVLTDAVSQLSSGSSELVNGTQKLVSNSSKLNDGASQLSEGSVKLNDGASQLSEGYKSLDDGIAALSDGSLMLHDGIKDGSDKLNAVKTSELTYDMFSSPVEAREEQITTVSTNGTAMSAYMMCVGLWVGCMAYCLIFEPEDTLLKGRKKGYGAVKSWLMDVPKLIGVAVIQAILMIVFLVLIDGFDPVYTGQLVAFSILTSLTFMTIEYCLNMLFGKIGSFVLLIFMVLQLSGSAGTYPIELSDSFYNSINQYMPFTYVVHAFRATTSGADVSIVKDVVVLSVILVVFTVLNMIGVFIKERNMISDEFEAMEVKKAEAVKA